MRCSVSPGPLLQEMASATNVRGALFGPCRLAHSNKPCLLTASLEERDAAHYYYVRGKPGTRHIRRRGSTLLRSRCPFLLCDGRAWDPLRECLSGTQRATYSLVNQCYTCEQDVCRRHLLPNHPAFKEHTKKYCYACF